jgi:hypothetical protein
VVVVVDDDDDDDEEEEEEEEKEKEEEGWLPWRAFCAFLAAFCAHDPQMEPRNVCRRSQL